jgi:hypothetical protein
VGLKKYDFVNDINVLGKRLFGGPTLKRRKSYVLHTPAKPRAKLPPKPQLGACLSKSSSLQPAVFVLFKKSG